MATRGWMGRSMRLIESDPEIYKFKTLWRDEHITESDLAVLAGLSLSTVKNMFGTSASGKQTRRPQHLTYYKLAKAMGHEYALTRTKKPDYESEVPKAREEYREYRAAQEKARRKLNGKKKSAR